MSDQVVQDRVFFGRVSRFFDQPQRAVHQEIPGAIVEAGRSSRRLELGDGEREATAVRVGDLEVVSADTDDRAAQRLILARQNP